MTIIYLYFTSTTYSYTYHTRSLSVKWTDTAPSLHRSVLLQRDDQHNWITSALTVVRTFFTQTPLIMFHITCLLHPLLIWTIRHGAILWTRPSTTPQDTLSILLTHFLPAAVSPPSYQSILPQSHTPTNSSPITPSHCSPFSSPSAANAFLQYIH